MKRILSALALLVLVTSVTANSAAEAPTWTKDIGPLMAEKCMNCHRPGQVAPMSLLTYREARPWAMSIREEVQRKDSQFQAALACLRRNYSRKDDLFSLGWGCPG